MEYEQLEHGKRVITQCIYKQDLSQYNELLSPNVLLINHFPFPTSAKQISKVNSPALKEIAQTIKLLSTSCMPPQKLRSKYLHKVDEQLAIQKERYDTQHVTSFAITNNNINNSSSNSNNNNNNNNLLLNELALNSNRAVNIVNGSSSNTKVRQTAIKNASKNNNNNNNNNNNCKSNTSVKETFSFDEKHPRESVFVEQYLEILQNESTDNDNDYNDNDDINSKNNNDNNNDDNNVNKKNEEGAGSNHSDKCSSNTLKREATNDDDNDLNKIDSQIVSRDALTSQSVSKQNSKTGSLKNITNVNNTTSSTMFTVKSKNSAKAVRVATNEPHTTLKAQKGVLTKAASANHSRSENNNNNNYSHSKCEATRHASYGDFVDIAEGRDLVAAHFCYLLCWLNNKTYLAETEIGLKARKGILQDNEVLPAPPTPRNEAAKYALIGEQFTSRNQMLSRLTVTYGTEFLLFQDQCYFNEGHIVTIHRRLVPLSKLVQRVSILQSQHPFLTKPTKTAATSTTTTTTTSTKAINSQYTRDQESKNKEVEPTQRRQKEQTQEGEARTLLSTAVTHSQQIDAIRREITSLYNLTAHPLRAISSSWPMLDFSFIDCSDIAHLLLESPCDGKVHSTKAIRPRVDPRWAQGVFLNAENDPTQYKDNDRILIKAKNKRGDEEAYEFEKEGHRFSFMLDGKDDDRVNGNGGSSKDGKCNIPIETLISNLKFKYDACNVRVSGCKLESRIDKFVPILRGLVANALITIHSLDLSDNELCELPNFSSLPLQKLQLHSNKISDWDEVEQKICVLPYLYALTLHGNPLSEFDKTYWPHLLSLLIGNSKRQVLLKQVDFVTLTAQDFNVAASYAAFITGNTMVRQVVQSLHK